ncbi:MAG: hypothetical protein AAGN82_04590 [Myxococcota bacterium]
MATATAAPPAAPPPTGQILFVSERVTPRSTFAVSTSPPHQPALIARSDDDVYPAEPGRFPLFVQSAGEHGPEWVSRLEGATLNDLGPRSRHVRNPTWVDAGVVVEASYRSFRDLYLLADTAHLLTDTAAEPRRLTVTEHGAFEPHGRGTRVVYVSSADRDAELFRLDITPGGGTEPQRLTWSRGADTGPRWSPDGTHIAFLSVRQGGGIPRVFLMAADGGKPRPLRAGGGADDAMAEQDVRWSPDGSHVAFIERRPGRRAHLHVVRVADGAVRYQSVGDVIDEQPSWSPDGLWIAFSSNRGGNPDVYMARADGTGLRRLTQDPAPDWLPRWIPAASEGGESRSHSSTGPRG